MIQRRRKQIYSVDAKLYLCDDAYDSLLREVEEILEEEMSEDIDDDEPDDEDIADTDTNDDE